MRELKPQKRWFRFVGRLLIFFGLAAMAGHYGWGKYGEAVLHREVERYRAAGEPLTVDELADGTPLPAEQNAAVDLVAAADQMLAESKLSWVRYDVDSWRPLGEQQRVLAVTLIGRCDGAWARLAAAERKASARWDDRELDPERRRGNVVWHVSTLAPFLYLAARHSHEVGDDRRAVACVRQLLAVGRAVRQERRHHFIAALFDAAAAHAILQFAPDLRLSAGGEGGAGGGTAADARDVREIVTGLLDDGPRRTSFVWQLKYERAETYERLHGFLDGRADLLGGPLVGLEKRASWYALRPISLVDLAMLLRQADRIIAVAGVAPDRHSFRSLAPDLEEPREATGRPRLHLIANLCGPRYEHLVRSYFEETVERRLAATALALRCYRLEHGGAFPPSLDDLVPTFLPAVPADPMVADRRLSYRSGGSDPVLYSLGADGKDDGASDAPADDLRCLVNDDWSGLTQRRDAVVHLFGPVGPHEPWRSRPIGE